MCQHGDGVANLLIVVFCAQLWTSGHNFCVRCPPRVPSVRFVHSSPKDCAWSTQPFFFTFLIYSIALLDTFQDSRTSPQVDLSLSCQQLLLSSIVGVRFVPSSLWPLDFVSRFPLHLFRNTPLPCETLGYLSSLTTFAKLSSAIRLIRSFCCFFYIATPIIR